MKSGHLYPWLMFEKLSWMKAEADFQVRRPLALFAPSAFVRMTGTQVCL